MSEYPAHLVRERCLADGRRVLIRPIRAEDEAAARAFFDGLSEDTRRLRFMKYVRWLSPETVRYYTHVDYDTHMAFVCEHDGRLVGDARYVMNIDGKSAEFSVVIADDWHHTGIAGLLMQALLDAARARGLPRVEGLVLRENRDMVRFVRALGFEVAVEPLDPTLVRVTKALA